MSDYRYCKHCGWFGHVEDTVGDRVLDPSWRNDPEYQDWGSCPKCHLGTVEGQKCRDCDEPYPADDLHEGRCPECYVEWKAIQPELDTARKAIWDFVDNIKTIRGQK